MVKKAAVLLISIFFLIKAPVVIAERIGGQSALLGLRIQEPLNRTMGNTEQNYRIKKKVISEVLKRYHSPMTEASDSFVKACLKYDLDCYLLPSIAGHESYFGTYLLPSSYNPFGWGRGLIYFKNWDEGIDMVAKGLRENYINKGATTIEEIGAIYCEGNTWAGKVQSIRNTFIQEEAKHGLYFSKNQVEL